MANKSFELKFKMDNSIFDEDPLTEIIRILYEVRDELGCGNHYGKIMDVNGNSIGTYKVKGV
jgi:hypothetical protein